MNRIVAVALLITVAGVETAQAGVEGTVVVSAGVQAQPVSPPRYRRHRGPRLMAPLRIDLGGTFAGSDYGLIGGPEASVGIHWASLSPTPTDFDVGLGVFAGDLGGGTIPDDNLGNPQSITFAGVYGEFGKTLSSGDFWRTWALGRGEYLASDGLGEQHRGLGASAKLEAELYLSGVGLSPDGIFLGTYAIGVYVEGAVRRVHDDVRDVQLGVGLTIRTPMVWRW